MVERYEGEQLPPAHPVRYSNPPLPDGQGVPQPPLPPHELHRARLLFVLAATVILAGVIIGAFQ